MPHLDASQTGEPVPAVSRAPRRSIWRPMRRLVPPLHGFSSRNSGRTICDTYSVYNKGVYHSIQLLSHSLVMSNMCSSILVLLNQTDIPFVLWIENCLVCQSIPSGKTADAISLVNVTLCLVFGSRSSVLSLRQLSLWCLSLRFSVFGSQSSVLILLPP